MNGSQVRVARLQGAFDWHKHDDGEEAFFIQAGVVRIAFRDPSGDLGAVTLEPGDFLVIPRGLEHRPEALAGDALAVIISPAGSRNTGDRETALTASEIPKLDPV